MIRLSGAVWKGLMFCLTIPGLIMDHVENLITGSYCSAYFGILNARYTLIQVFSSCVFNTTRLLQTFLAT